MKRGAAATTYAHDHHNLLVIGQNKKDMTIAANTIIKNQGGYVAVLNDKIEAFAPLPIAGILSDQPLPVLGGQIKQIRQSLEQLGYEHNNVIMSLSTLSLPVSPFLKLTDRGIIDVQRQKIVPLVV
jgi:adenine deaminase